LLVGSLSDGDVRRWLINNKNIDLNVPLSGIANQPCFSLPLDTRTEKISKAFNKHIIKLFASQAHFLEKYFLASEGEELLRGPATRKWPKEGA